MRFSLLNQLGSSTPGDDLFWLALESDLNLKLDEFFFVTTRVIYYSALWT